MALAIERRSSRPAQLFDKAVCGGPAYHAEPVDGRLVLRPQQGRQEAFRHAHQRGHVRADTPPSLEGFSPSRAAEAEDQGRHPLPTVKLVRPSDLRLSARPPFH